MKSFTVVSVNVSLEKGVVKKPVPKIRLVKDFGVEGDAHGGLEKKQVSFLAEESIEKMRAHGLELNPGDFAENITTEGIILHALPIGTEITINDCRLEISQIGKKCHKGCAIRDKTGECIMPAEGVFARVIQGGTIKAGEEGIAL